MRDYVLKRMLQSLISLVGLVILVFFLVRLTGSPADLYLPTTPARRRVRSTSAFTGWIAR